MSDSSTEPTELPVLGTLPASLEMASPEIGLTVPGYELLGELGRGGMGVVYKARQLKLNRLVALKMLTSGWQSEPELIARFRNEAEAVARLQHPNIVQIFEVGDANGRPFLALEFVSGGTLAAYLARQPQPAADAAEITRTLASAVHHAHEQGILHRDLKPANILINAELNDRGDAIPHSAFRVPNLKVADFGLAKHLNSSDGPTLPGDVLGTPSYMAPEQAGGVTLRPTAALDVYALGAILYEMLTGRPPFLGATPTETVVQVLSQEPVAPRQLRPDCPRDLETICLKCLQKVPSRRYPSAAELANDLGRWLADEPIHARPAGRVERAMKWTRRNPAAAATIVASFILIAVGIIYGWQLQRHNRALRDAEREQRAAREQAEHHFQIARRAVKELLGEVAAEDLRSVPHMDSIRRSLLQKALAAMQRLLAQDRHHAGVRRELAQTAGDAGEVYEMLGEMGPAEKHFRESVELFAGLASDPNADAATRREHALSLFRLATFLSSIGRSSDAEPVFDETIRLLNAELVQRPGDPEATFALARSLLNRGSMLDTIGRFPEGGRDSTLARDLLMDLARDHPASREFRERLATAHNNLGVHHRTVGRLNEAALAYAAAVDEFKRLTDEHPNERSYRSRLGIAARNLGGAYWWLGENPGADAAFRQAVEETRRCHRDFPGVPEYAHELALALEALGEMLDYDGKPEGAVLYGEALEIKRRLLAEQPKHPVYLLSQGRSYTLQAVANRNRSDWHRVDIWERRAIEQYQTALRASPQDVRAKMYLRSELLLHSRTLLRINRLHEAVRAAIESAEIFPANADDALRSAVVLGECAVHSVGVDGFEYRQLARTQLNRALNGGIALEHFGASEAASLRTLAEFWNELLKR